MKLKWKKLTALVMLALTVNASISALAKEIESRKLTVIQVDGTEAEIKKPNGSIINAGQGISLGQGNQVSTGKNTYVYITADDDKTFKMDSNTRIGISKESAKSLKVLLEKGQLFFNVDKPLGDDEELTFDAANTSMSIRGTSGWLRCNANVLEFYLIEGSVIWTINGQQLLVNAGETVTLERDWGGEQPGPGKDSNYRYESKTFYTWEELPDDALVAVMENLDKIDLSAIGLDTPEAIAAAEAKVQEILNQREQMKQAAYHNSYDDDDDDDDDDWYWSDDESEIETTTAPETSAVEATTAATTEKKDNEEDKDNNAGNNGSGNGNGSSNENGSDNGNGNSNENGSGNENGNSNENGSGSGNGNGNSSGSSNESESSS